MTGPGPDRRASPRRAAARAAPWAVSLALHAALVGAGFVVVWSTLPDRDDDGSMARVTFFDPAPLAAPPDAEAADDRAEPDPAEPAPLPAPDRAAPEAPELDDILAALADAPESARRDEAPRAAPTDLLFERTYPDVRFYGVGAGDAERVVYVVDASGSMISTFPLILDELRRSIARLAPTQRFQVIFFRGDPGAGRAGAVAAPHPDQPERTRETRLIRATRDRIAAVGAWLDSVRPAGRSNPIPALERALALRPDAVFLLSTEITGAGAWELDEAEILARLAALDTARDGGGRVAIKVIQFLGESESPLLRAIGERHGGHAGYTLLSREQVLQRAEPPR